MVRGSPRCGRSIGSVWLVALLGVAACVPSLGAVHATAGIGLQLSSYDGAFDQAIAYCHYGDLSGTPDPQCAQLQADSENWHAVNRALVGYATALNAMADDAKDQSEQDGIATVLASTATIIKPWSSALNTNVTTGVSHGVSTLIAGILGVYRRERLAGTINDSSDALAAIARGLDDNILLLDRADQNLLATIADTITSIQAGSSPAADKLGLALALQSDQAALAAHRAALAGYKATVDSFAKAHADLRKKLSGLGDRTADLELLKLIASDVSAIVKNTRTAMTPVPQ
jgi:hypothetical protein